MTISFSKSENRLSLFNGQNQNFTDSFTQTSTSTYLQTIYPVLLSPWVQCTPTRESVIIIIIIIIIIMFNIFIAQISIWIWSNALCNSNQHCPNLYFTIIIHKSNQMLVFDERGKPEYPGKNLSWQSREPTNSIHIWHRVRKSNPDHISGRQVLSPLGQHCHQNLCSS